MKLCQVQSSCGMQDVQHSVCNPFFKHFPAVVNVANWLRARGVVTKKLATVSRAQLRRVNCVKPGSLRELKVRNS